VKFSAILYTNPRPGCYYYVEIKLSGAQLKGLLDEILKTIGAL
jgi:hypothetical protein